MPAFPLLKIEETLSNDYLQNAVYTSTGRLIVKRKDLVSETVLPDYQELRDQANRIKRHTIDNLDYYLEQLESKVVEHGGKVLWCRDGGEVVDFLVKLAAEKNTNLIVKSKSMVTEEFGMNERLAEHGLEPVETDLGEFIIQLAHEKPYHIVLPALHMTRYQVADLFTEKLGVEREEVIEKQTKIARTVLRQKFLHAGIGITGANFLVAESGAVVMATNEGNGRFTSTAPKVHVVIAGIEKLVPRAKDLATFLKLLARSATGQPLTVYTSFLSGPRRPNEIDGPEEFYLVLLDNGRTKLLADREKRQSLYCIRCGSCLNHCPVYRKIGGHNYPWVYSGPIGSIITPQYQGVMQSPWLPFASSLCGACAEVCPVKIDIPKLLLLLRSDVNKAKEKEHKNWLEHLIFRGWAWLMRHPKLFELGGMMGSAVLTAPEGGGLIRNVLPFFRVGPLKAWIKERDLPPLPEKSFRQLWRERVRVEKH